MSNLYDTQRHLLNTASTTKVLNSEQGICVVIQEYIDPKSAYIDADPQAGFWLRVQPEYHVLVIVQSIITEILHMNLEQLLDKYPWYLSERNNKSPIMGETALLTNC